MNIELFETGTSDSREEQQLTGALDRLKEHNITITRIAQNSQPDKFTACAQITALLQQYGETILPITLVNSFPMITGRYPTPDEIRQMLNVPKELIEPKQCGCCCIEGCSCGK